MKLFSVIKNSIAILDVVQEYVALKKNGSYYKGLCPLHNERTSSFTVSPDRGIFYCFGCHEGGDVIYFVSRVERCTQLEAARELKSRFNIEVHEPEEVQHISRTDRERYFALTEVVLEWAREQLNSNPTVMAYLLERKISKEMIGAFKLGYFPQHGIKSLCEIALKKGFSAKDLIDIHVLHEGKTIYSPFQDRIIFPLKDAMGRCCAFAGRTFAKTDERVKYYNSQEHQFFSKGSMLYGLDRAKKAIHEAKMVVLVEGYTDCVLMHQSGYVNTVATMGTACTLEHLVVLARHASELVIMYDGDEAGAKGVMRLAELCWQVDLEISVIQLPKSYDPASYIEKNGNMKELMQSRLDLFTFLINRLGEHFYQKSLHEKLESIDKICLQISQMRDPLKQELVLQQAAKAFQIPVDVLYEALAKKHSLTAIVAEDDKKNSNKKVLEVDLFCAILKHAMRFEKEDELFITTIFPAPYNGVLQKWWAWNDTGGQNVQDFTESVEPEDQRIIHEAMMYEGEFSPAAIKQALIHYQRKHWKTVVNHVKLKVTQAEKLGEKEDIKKILSEFQAMKNKMAQRGIV